MRIEEVRNRIDAIDQEIASLLSARNESVRQIGRLKEMGGLPVRDNARETEVLRRVCRSVDGAESAHLVRLVFLTILNESRKLQHRCRTEELV